MCIYIYIERDRYLKRSLYIYMGTCLVNSTALWSEIGASARQRVSTSPKRPPIPSPVWAQRRPNTYKHDFGRSF